MANSALGEMPNEALLPGQSTWQSSPNVSTGNVAHWTGSEAAGWTLASLVRVVHARAVEARLERRAADVAADLVPDRAGDAGALEADLIGGTGGSAGGAVIAVPLQVSATTLTAGQSGSAGGVAGPAVALVAVEEEALAGAFVAAALAAALPAAALRALAAVTVDVAILADFLALRPGNAPNYGRQRNAKHAADNGFQGLPPSWPERKG